MLDPAARLIELLGPRPKVVVAFSGGMDSTVLVHLLAKRRRQLGGLRLIHIDHALQPASAEWSRHCARQAARWRLPFRALRIRVTRGRTSPEAAAREARYRALAAALLPGEVLVTAQHRDDQVETLLLQLFRGAGVAGLAAMPATAPFGPGTLARPLLGAARRELEAVGREARLRWIEDPSNADTRFSRNFLRHRLLPLIREHWEGVDKALARSAEHMASAARLLEERATADLARLADGAGLSVTALRALSPSRRRNALRGFIAGRGLEVPGTAQLREMSGALLDARRDAQPEVRWPGGCLRRRGSRLELDTPADTPATMPAESASKSWRWKQERVLLLNASGDSLRLVDDAAGPLDLDKLPRRLSLRPRVGGESLRPGPRARTQSLKKLLQAARLTVQERARLPMLFDGAGPEGRLIAAGDRWIDASVAATVKSRRRARLLWVRGK
jgi:tRNA(Ile)-lysidine synthase